MAKLKKYDLKGNQIDEVEIDDKWLKCEVHPRLVKEYVVALLANRRQWSANTKGRSEIAHSNSKPHAQKGTGRARQGTIKAAQYKGGATVFGPKPKFRQLVRMNRREKRAVVRAVLAEKIEKGEVSFLRIEQVMEKPATKEMAKTLRHIGIDQKKVLFLSDQDPEKKRAREVLYLSLRNLTNVSFMPVESVSGYDVMKCTQLLIAEGAVDHVKKILKG